MGKQIGNIWDKYGTYRKYMGNPSSSMEFDFSWEDHGSKMVDVPLPYFMTRGQGLNMLELLEKVGVSLANDG